MTKPPPALLLIDVQQGFDHPRWGPRNNPQAESQMARLLKAWREQGHPIIHVRHHSTQPDSPLHPDQVGSHFKAETMPLAGEMVFTKHVNSAFIGTGLEQYLRSHGITGLVICGLTTDHCVSTTTRMAGNFGFGVVLVSDATATFDRQGVDGERILAEEVHRVHLASLQGEFCQVTTTGMVLTSQN